MNETNFRRLLRALKQKLAASTSERILLELEVDQGIQTLSIVPGQLVRRSALVETVSLANLVSGTIGLTTQLPANSRVLFAGLYVEGVLTMGAATSNLSLGVPTGTNITAFLTGSTLFTGTSIPAATTMVLPVPDTTARLGGTSANTVVLALVNAANTVVVGANATATGTVKVEVVFEYAQSMLP